MRGIHRTKELNLTFITKIVWLSLAKYLKHPSYILTTNNFCDHNLIQNFALNYSKLCLISKFQPNMQSKN